MRLDQISETIQMVRLHYFSMDDTDASYFPHMKLRKDRRGNWYLPEYNTSGRDFAANLSTLMRSFGRPRSITL